MVLKLPLHNGGHLKSYYKYLQGHIKTLDNIQGRLTNNQLLEKVLNVEDVIRMDLLNGKIKLQNGGW